MLPLKDENPTSHRAWVTFALIALNVVVFVWLQGMNDPQRTDADFPIEWAAIPCEVVTGDGLTPYEIEVTFSQGVGQACDLDPAGRQAFPRKPVRLAVIFSMFMHAGWFHLAGNIWFLWIFGNNVEDRLGPGRYLLFYVAGGIVATIAHIGAEPDSTIPVVGASGAVAAIMGAYAVWFPNAPIRTLLVIILWNVKAKWWLGFWFVTQFFTGVNTGVAWMAHVGGFAFGVVVALFVRRSRRLLPPRITADVCRGTRREGQDQGPTPAPGGSSAVAPEGTGG